MRSIPVEWSLFGSGPWDYSTNAQNIYNFWVVGVERSKTFESLYTMGMRGDGDREPIRLVSVLFCINEKQCPCLLGLALLCSSKSSQTRGKFFRTR